MSCECHIPCDCECGPPTPFCCDESFGGGGTVDCTLTDLYAFAPDLKCLHCDQADYFQTVLDMAIACVTQPSTDPKPRWPSSQPPCAPSR